MSKTSIEPRVYAQLRDKAEEQLQAGTTASQSQWSVGVDALRLLHRLSSNPESAEDALKLLHELQVHQVELDLQIEEISDNERAVADELSLYRKLFDFAPVGYLLIDFEGNIIQGNLAAAELLGAGRDDLDGHPIATFLPARSRPLLLGLLERVKQSGARDHCQAEAGGGAHGSRHLQFLASLPAGGEHILLACCECGNADISSKTLHG
ncbi:MAG: PAS domain S-box protein [Halomonas sp.]|uniref:PAS domain S-box protein n=1 Tax=Halomonas sp. TaxID=1486246 RepID=UPI001A062CBD|nr:PAS domain S-box protein [Halomonas sp.]